jgi:hypothetical protein
VFELDFSGYERAQWRVLVSAVMNLEVEKAGEFLTG